MSDDIGAPSAAAPSAAPSTATAPTPAAQPASATSSPAHSAPAASTPSTGQTGEPPKERWPDILNHTRTKTRAEVEQEYRQKYGWADEFTRDPWSFTQRQLDQMANHPEYEKNVLNYAARLLNSKRGKTVEEPQPDVPVIDQNGNVVSQAYSAKAIKALLEYEREHSGGELTQRIGAIEKALADAQQREALVQLNQESDKQSRQLLGELRQKPYFTEHEAKIKQVFADHPEWGDNIYRAYLEVLTGDVLPALSQTEQKKVLDSLQTKAAAGTVNPGQQTASQRPKFKNFSEAIKYYHDHPSEAETMAKG